ncbi:hypothetical protein ACFZB9_25620 [Kitasatospora sp. NPDC008050]
MTDRPNTSRPAGSRPTTPRSAGSRLDTSWGDGAPAARSRPVR